MKFRRGEGLILVHIEHQAWRDRQIGLRLFLYASLAEVAMAPDYTQAIVMEMLETVVAEVAHEKGVPVPRQRKTAHEIGWILHGDADTYRYIPASIRNYPGAAAVAKLMQARGFSNVRHYSVFGGLMAIHHAYK